MNFKFKGTNFQSEKVKKTFRAQNYTYLRVETLD